MNKVEFRHYKYDLLIRTLFESLEGTLIRDMTSHDVQLLLLRENYRMSLVLINQSINRLVEKGSLKCTTPDSKSYKRYGLMKTDWPESQIEEVKDINWLTKAFKFCKDFLN